MIEDSVLKGSPKYDVLARDGRRKLKGDWDIDKYTLKNFIIENLASDPSNPLAGRLWYNSVDGLARYFDGTKIRTLLGDFQLAGGTPTPETVGEAGSFGVSPDGIPMDHVHAGVRSLCKKLSTQLMGDVKLVAGTNITLNQTDVDKEIEIVASGGGAPTDASYVTIVAEAGLSNETLHENILEVNKHTPKAHTLASHSTKAHSELTGVTSDQHHAQTNEVKLINADEVQASGAASSTEANMKTYSLPANSYSRILIEADGYFVCGSTQSNRFQFRIKIGASISSYQIITQGASLYSPFSIKFSAVQTATATISVCCTATVGDGTYYCNNLRVLGVI